MHGKGVAQMAESPKYNSVQEALNNPIQSMPTVMKIGGTTFEIYTHWNPDGRQTMLEQLMKLILNADMEQVAEDEEQVA